ncbi:MAG: hypothetical protein AB1486_35070 [Planctomycetota bacterium]
MRDLDVLTTYYREYSGKLRVQRGGAAADLYAARVRTVKSSLVNGGVDISRIEISEGLPGGDGVDSERAVRLLIAAEKTSTKSSTTTSAAPTAEVLKR